MARYELQLDDYVLLHVGFAIAKLDPTEAQRTLELLDEATRQPAGLLDG